MWTANRAPLAGSAHHEYVRSLPVALGLRGLRARFGHLQVGVANLFDRAQNRRVTYVRFNAENLHERNPDD